MKKTLLLCLVAGLFLSANAVKTKVAYISPTKTMYVPDASYAYGAPSAQNNDPIIRVLSADTNLEVTVLNLTSVLATDVIANLDTYDVIIVQESFGGTSGMLTPSGALALKTISKPFIYNKNYALQTGRALPSGAAGAGKEADGTLSGTLSIAVETSALTHDLFKACTFENTNQIKLFNALSTDPGQLGVSTSIKAINYNSGVVSTGGTLLAQPTIVQSTSPSALCINYFPSGSTFNGTETTKANAIFVGMNYGAICANAGLNMTDNNLTIWRNAVYILAGLPVPSTKAVLPTTAVKNVDGTLAVKSVEYFTVNGLQVRTPSNGVYVKRTTFENGAVKLDKMVLTEPMMK